MISVENATFTYPGATSPILRNVSFEVPERSLLAILGPNGAGKTTLLRTMIGLQKWDSGRTLIDGTPISSMSTRALGRVLSYVPQARNASNVALTGLEMVMVGRARTCAPSHSPERARNAWPATSSTRWAPPTWPRCPARPCRAASSR